MTVMRVFHDIENLIQSSPSNCLQTATASYLSFYGINVSPAAIEKEIPVRKDDDGHPIGTFFADIGAWIINTHHKKVVMNVFDVQIIDRSWQHHARKDLLAELEAVQQTGIASAHTPYQNILINAYLKFLNAGGTVNITKCTNDLLRGLLNKGPVLAVINFNYLYDYPRRKYDPDKKEYVTDTTNGQPISHAVVLTGYENDLYFYNDPDAKVGGQKQVASDILIGAICTSQLNSNNYILSIDN